MFFLSWAHLEFYLQLWIFYLEFILIHPIIASLSPAPLGVKPWEVWVYWTPLALPCLGFPTRTPGQLSARSAHSTRVTCSPVWPPPRIWGRALLLWFTHFCWSSLPWRPTGQILLQTVNLAKIVFRVSYCFLFRCFRQIRQRDKHLLNIYYVPGILPVPGSKKKRRLR